MEKEKETIVTSELRNSLEFDKGIGRAVKTAGVRGLSSENAMKLGYFDRIKYLLSLITVSFGAVYRVYGHVDALLTEFGVKRHEIKKNCTDLENAFERFISFWSGEGYFINNNDPDLEKDIDELYRLLMRFGRLPIEWGLGDEQKAERAPSALRVDNGDKYLFMYRTVLKREFIGEPEKQWCVSVFDEDTKKQEYVHTGMTKADAMMVAKRLSAENPHLLYAASVLTDFTEKRTEVTPMYAYRGNEQVAEKASTMEV